MIASVDNTITIIGHVAGDGAVGRLGRCGNTRFDGTSDPIENDTVEGADDGIAPRPELSRAGIRGPATGRSFEVRLPSDGSAVCACGLPARSAARSVLQCLQRPATGWIQPLHDGHGTRASGPIRLTMLQRLD